MVRAAPRTRWLPAFAAYFILSVLLTWPLVLRIGAVVPNDTGDPLLNSWILWWNAHHVPLTRAWWNAQIFWPTDGALALSEHLLGLSLIATPLQWFGADPVTAYAVVFLLSFPLCAIAAYALGYTLTRRHDAAFVGGLVFGFNPYRIAHFPHIQVLASWWLPLALVGLHQYLARREPRWLWLYGASWLFAGLSNGYYMLFLPVLIALWMFWFVPVVSSRRVWIALLATSVVSSLPLLWIAWQYRQAHVALGLHRGYEEILSYSPDLAGVLDASPLLTWWNLTKFHKGEGELFPGLTAVVLVALPMIGGVLTTLRRRSPKASTFLFVLAIVWFGAAGAALVGGSWSVTIAGSTLVSVARVRKPFQLGFAFLALAIALHPRVRTAVRHRSAILFYVLATVVLYWLALGPEPRVMRQPILGAFAPYRWLMMIPGFETARVPSRFIMIALVALSTAASLAFARLTARRAAALRPVLAVCVCAGILADTWISEMPLRPRPPRIALLTTMPAGSVVLELPIPDTYHETAAMYRSMYHGRPLVNGYSGFEPKRYTDMRDAIGLVDARVIGALASAAPLIVVLDTKADDGGRWARILEADSETAAIAREGDFRLFTVGRALTIPHR
ncbi:MAG TPA: hypothetical protein VKH42_09430 [Vicinamibacterales bacterium]|nr:hypothetical protein [Vicinamibacterales bacterium]